MDDMKDALTDLLNDLKDGLRQAGIPVHLDTEFCRHFRSNHEGCGGCESEEGCKRITAVSGLFAMFTELINVPDITLMRVGIYSELIKRMVEMLIPAKPEKGEKL
jgi:hypothetical protein